MTHADSTNQANRLAPCPPGPEDHSEPDEALNQELLREALELDDFQDRITLVSHDTEQ